MDRYIVTLQGRRVSLAGGCPTLYDIAISHCRTPMFAGHTKLPYSVAHHCVSAARLGEADGPTVALYCLLHETETSVFGDVPGPVKTDRQREVEKDVRDRTYAGMGIGKMGDSDPSVHVRFSPQDWEKMELWDKIEQAGSAIWLGLPETVHDKIWRSVRHSVRERALYYTKFAYDTFPPKEQLDEVSPLASHFMKMFNLYYGMIGE